MRYKTKILIMSLLIVLSLAACSRERLRRNEDTPAPTQAESRPATIDPVQLVTPTQPAQSPVSVDTATVSPNLPIPTAQMPDLTDDFSELDNILKDLDEILGSTDTDISIP